MVCELKLYVHIGFIYVSKLYIVMLYVCELAFKFQFADKQTENFQETFDALNLQLL